MRFIPHTSDDIREMLAVIGVDDVDGLFTDIPADLRSRAAIRISGGLPEQEVVRVAAELAARNRGADCLSFLGAGAYAHFVPAVVDQILQRAEFYSAYTPYQPEVSQGTLQAIFEFQTLVSALFDLDVANASMYDGASAAAEAVLMALRVQPKRRRVLMARSLHPDYRQATATYLQGVGESEVVEIPFASNGRVDADWLRAQVDTATAAVVVGYPNFFGVLEDLRSLAGVVRESGALLVTATPEPLALAVAQPPGALGVDIAVGEGQSLGVPLQYGGPGVGLFATRVQHVRNMPGRLVGEAVDGEGRRGYVLTLATREQHIRRERATSNICTNHGLMALAVTVYMSLLGKHGLRRLACTNLQRARQACARLCGRGRWTLRFEAPFFNEFAVKGPGVEAALRRAEEAGVLAGVALSRWYPELEDTLLIALTEVHDAAAIERLAQVLEA